MDYPQAIVKTRLRKLTTPPRSAFSAIFRRADDKEHLLARPVNPERPVSPSQAEGVAMEVGAMTSGAGRLKSMAPIVGDSAVWSVVLAGGEGERLRPLMERWWGFHRPKQYCTFVGRRSMLQHTLGRAESLSGAGRMLVVVANHHEPHNRDQLDGSCSGVMMAQPWNRGTAAGIFLPLTYIGAKDPGSTVVILPSDHFVHPEEDFIVAVHRATLAAQQLPDKLVLLGARPDIPETEYGWIQTGDPVAQVEGCQVRKVAGFQEKPDEGTARRLLEGGALWNTFVIAAKWQTLWQLGWQCFPALMERFESLAVHIGTPTERSALESIYTDLPILDFSSGLLQRVPDALVVMELKGVTWCDWGNEERIIETLRRIGKTPLFLPRQLA